MYRTLFLILSLVPLALADDSWEDFTNNLATDLAPLIVLFGDRLTKQFLSESIKRLDNIIFALSPLGILTTVVSVIRVRGGSSLRAFIGRAQEGPAEAESELLPCVSDSTAELFNDGGISRVFGRPRILEIVAWENEDPKTGRRSREIGTLLDAITKSAWSVKDTGCSLEEWGCQEGVSIPNLSLNKGIKGIKGTKSRGRFWSFCAAILGSLLQIGVIIYAAVTVFVYPYTFKKNGKLVPSYAFPFFVAGSTLLFIGMFFSAVIIGRSSKEYLIEPKRPSKIYWLQPGNQNVGDQVFGAFLAVKEAPGSQMTTDLHYIKSIRVHRSGCEHVEIYLTVFSTMLGFVIQFIGLRGLHASVILASVGATFLMSVVRTCLRTERMTPDENYLKEDRRRTSHKQQELDFFGFHLEQIKSFSLFCSSPLDARLDHISSNSSEESPDCLIDRLIQTRARLAELTSRPGWGGNIPWDGIPIRTAAHNLAKTIEGTMDLLSTWTAGFDKTFEFRLAIECQLKSPQSTLPVRGTYSISLQRCGDALKWRANVYELEAILGLWIWSLYQSDGECDHSLYRMIGLSAAEASREETYLYFHKWIFRQTEARMVSSEVIDDSRRRFGFDSERYAFDRDILVVQTENELETMAAQDIYIEFLRHAFPQIGALGGDVDVSLGLQNTFLVQSNRIDEMVRCFESAGLGSREDALLCIVPVLKDQHLLPEFAGDTGIVRKRIEDFIQRKDWKSAFALLHWICERSEGSEFERSVYELGYLCRRGLLATDGALGSGPSESLKYIRKIVSSDIRKDFRKAQRMSPPSSWSESSDFQDWWRSFASQLLWVARHISANVPGMDDLKGFIHGSSRDIAGIPLLVEDTDITDITMGAGAMREWLTTNDVDFDREYTGEGDELGYQWALERGFYALLYSALARWVEVGANCPTLIESAYAVAAQNRSDWGIQILQRRDTSIDTLSERNITALMEVTVTGNLGAVQALLENGANPDGDDKVPDRRPICLAAHLGFVSIIELLLKHGATLDILDNVAQSALHWACREDRLDTVRFLLDQGAMIDRIGLDNKTALHSAVAGNQVKLVELLLEKGADINLPECHHGRTALILAAENSDMDLLRLLIAKGAKLDARDYEGRTALDWAKRRESQATVSILEEAIRRQVDSE